MGEASYYTAAEVISLNLVYVNRTLIGHIRNVKMLSYHLPLGDHCDVMRPRMILLFTLGWWNSVILNM